MEQGLLSSCSVWASLGGRFSCFREQALGHAGFSSCSAQAQLPHGMWNPSGLGIEPVFPVLADKFLTTGPLGKSQDFLLILHYLN